MKCSLVATDGSDCANRAVDNAAHLAKVDGSDLLYPNSEIMTHVARRCAGMVAS
jgi:nucleotide-binding universal stress UspA family protein